MRCFRFITPERAIPRRATRERLDATGGELLASGDCPLPLAVREWYGTVHGAGDLIGFIFRRHVRPGTLLDTRTG
jgi:hypothetical protein